MRRLFASSSSLLVLSSLSEISNNSCSGLIRGFPSDALQTQHTPYYLNNQDKHLPILSKIILDTYKIYYLLSSVGGSSATFAVAPKFANVRTAVAGGIQ